MCLVEIMTITSATVPLIIHHTKGTVCGVFVPYMTVTSAIQTLFADTFEAYTDTKTPIKKEKK